MIKRLITAFFVSLIFRPGRILFRLFFYLVAVKLYRLYFFLMRKLGWSFRLRKSSLGWLVNQKLIHATVGLTTLLIIGLNLTNKSQARSSEELVGRTFLAELVSSEFTENDGLIEEFFDSESVISPAQQSYLDNLSLIREQPQIQTREENQLTEEQNITGIGQGGVLVRPELAETKKVSRLREKTVEYTVQSGDTVSTIAAEFEVSVNTILWENNLSAYSLIRPGDAITILPVSGVTHKVASGETLGEIASNYDIEEQKIIDFNQLADAAKLSIGQKLIIPDGKKPSYTEYASQSYTGFSALKDLVAPPSAKSVQGNKMNWPTEGHRITQYYSWRHHAVDIANKQGTPIYAADAGVIEYIGWGQGYGNQIVIDHGGGKQTRYAHLSKFYVAKGQQVDKGETIAAMGSTGWSTGPHVHFEVIINGAKYNPLNYIK